jgi:rare lipoprotein A
LANIGKGEQLNKWMIGLVAFFAMTIGSEARSWTGKASYYGLKGHTASGGRAGSFTAAHRTLPFGTKVRVTNLTNHRSVVVTITDRGPFTGSRVIDVSAQAADSLGFRAAGVVWVRVETIFD